MGLFGTSGIRRVFDGGLIQLALKVGLAVGRVYGRVVIGRDTRTSGSALEHAVISGVLASGASCTDIGILPTPTVAFAARKFGAGIMITASHNPPEYNGIKLINPDGAAFDASQRQQIEDLVKGNSVTTARWDKIVASQQLKGVIEEHTERILKDFPDGLKLKVVVDAGGGAAYFITPYLLRRMGAEVVTINCALTGVFPRDAEPTEANLEELLRVVRESGAALGIAHDGDAGRMMAVDDKGRFIPGDKLLVLLARELGAEEVVTTVDASMAIDEVGFRVLKTKVGDIYVSEELRGGGDFGGEPSGSWVFPTISLCPDGIYAAAQLATMANRGRLSPLIDELPSYPILRGSLRSEGGMTPVLEERLMTLEPLSVGRIDGLKLNFGDGWLLIRPSGTEPKIRVTAEAKSQARLRQLFDSAVKLIKES
ncbi:MAG: phosphoglucosamine mutase [Dehalococcoidales bacterium]|nr:phosphoglucosamine mutase [Dehalococcoidales bacterium]